jgi:alpha-tubulin suppressor-like RCC1 family protein
MRHVTQSVSCVGLNAFGKTSSPSGITILDVAAGQDHSCAVQTDNSPICWGNNDFGQATPTPGSYSAVGSGDGFSCGRLTTGEISCWGNIAAPPTGTFDQLSVGGRHACALRAADLTVECWGVDEFGETSPPAAQLIAVSAGVGLSCGILADDESITCWGGTGIRPRASDDLSGLREPGFQVVATGEGHVCGLSAGRIICWGACEGAECSPP